MITSTSNPAANGSVAATGANATPALTGAVQPPASPFDAILALEALAATCNALDPSVTTAGMEPGDTADLPATDVDERDDPDGSDAEDPLAFLAGLLNAAVPTPTPPPPQQPAAAAVGNGVGVDGDADGAIGDVLAGKGHRATAPVADTPISLTPPTVPDAAPAAIAPTAGAAPDASPSRLLAAIAPAPAADPNSVRNDSSQPPDAATANLARAVELLGHGSRHAAAVAKESIPTPVRDPNWAQDLGTKVAMMIRGGESTASLQLTPVDLGPLDVSVTVRDSQATVHFGAAQPETRALLEASIPRLREMLAAQGFNLMDASVSQGFARPPRAEPAAAVRRDAEAEPEVRTTARIGPLGMLDTYA